MLRLVMTRPLGIKIAVPVLIIFAFTSIGGGVELLRDPSGKSFGLQPMIPYLPLGLQDFMLVGVWLITTYGVLPLVLAAGLWFGKKWARIAAIGLGAVLITWIVTEILLFYSFGFTFLYPLYAGIGLLTIVILYLPSTREYFKH